MAACILRGKFKTKNPKVRAQANCNSWVEVAAETRNTSRQGMKRNDTKAVSAVTAAIPTRAQNAEAEYWCASSRLSLPLASASTLTKAFPASPKSDIDIQVI